jgi:hypothetical protein
MGFSADKARAPLNYILAAMLIAAGITVTAISLWQLEMRSIQTAQADPPGTSPSTDEPAKPADPEPGGTRPTVPAPTPARPDADAQKAGAKPALPPAPPEKIGEPVERSTAPAK